VPAPSAAPAPAPTAAPVPSQAGDLDAAAKQALQAKISALVAAAPITFGPDSPRLTPQGSATLEQVLTAVRAVPGARLNIDGYVATGRGNGLLTAQQLSDQRAATVRDALVAGGVPADHLTTRGRGEDAAATDRAFGRRVEITVV
jgi:outer membrane protein OmpA-like peptidoglycan-associated protein